MYIIYINCVPLFDGASSRRIESLNESIFMVIIYHMTIFTENNGGWTALKEGQIGKSMISCIMLLIVVNTIVILIAVTLDLKFQLRLFRLGNKQKQILKERDTAFEKSRKYMDLNSVIFSTVTQHARE